MIIKENKHIPTPSRIFTELMTRVPMAFYFSEIDYLLVRTNFFSSMLRKLDRLVTQVTL